MPIFETLVYVLCFLASLACTVLLSRAFARTGTRLLLWTALSFAGLTFANLLVFIDLRVLIALDLRLLRNAVTLLSIATLLYGFIWETD